jgi:hypothetical protein
MAVHYDLHVWVAERNPNGVIAQWNPALKCPSWARDVLSWARRPAIVGGR